MCLGIPVQVLRTEGTTALCRDHRGEVARIDTLLTGAQPPGTWLMTFLGAARAVIDADEAARVGRALEALQAMLAGEGADLDAAFADLVGREPHLPDFLQGEPS
jgi:hydrogenase expression/formation protein HypC